MTRATHAQVLEAIGNAIVQSEPNAVAYEIKRIEHQCEGMGEDVRVMARVDDDPSVVSDALIVGLKEISMRAGNGIVFDGAKLDWGKDDQNFWLLFFTVDMMKKCEV